MKCFFAALLAVLIGNVLLLAALGLIAAIQFRDDVDVQPGSVLVQTIAGPIYDYDPPTAGVVLGSGPTTHTTILENLEKAARDERIEAVVLKLHAPQIGWARADEIREAIERTRDRGVPVWAYMEYLNGKSLYLAGACDEVILFPGGYVSLTGIGAGRPFVKEALDKLGVRPNLHRIEDYKSAAEIVTREEMSEEARANLNWLLDVIYPNYVRKIEADRNLTQGGYERDVLSQGALVPREALELKLVDRLAYFDEVETALLEVKGVEERKRKSDDLPPRPRVVSGEEYAKLDRKDAGIKGKKTIAVVHAHGTIGGEVSGFAVPWGITMGAATMEKAFRDASRNKDVEAIIFRIDSGGGESATSWRIARAAQQAERIKPMVVSMGDVAASGGYTIAYRCSTLMAERLSVVGSIGSISGKFNLRGLYNKLGISWDFVTRGPNALMQSSYFDYTPEQYESFAERHWADYWEWVEHIAMERNLTPAEVDSVGRGKVWTGTEAVAHGLVDTLGGYHAAIEIAKAKAGIPEDEDVLFVHYPEREGPLEALRKGGFTMFLYAVLGELTGGLDHPGSWAIDLNQYR
ncbi:MAG: hypothetical protein GF346_06175 [Candidatus Eisenbacteria bacterium]|nr:hypothetical protein [Candidatus Latescibacterota bacterium]MBD3302012.1 hypothetical protein [Candidatus Eisenbacteria bacterium]